MFKVKIAFRFLLAFILLFVFSACATIQIAGNDDYYPKQCPKYKVINKIRKDFQNREYATLDSISTESLRERAHYEYRGRKLQFAYKIEDQRSVQQFEYFGFAKFNGYCSYDARHPKEGYNYGGTSGDCFLNYDIIKKLEEFFGKDPCQIDNIYKKTPDENIVIMERIDSNGVLSFKYISSRKEKEALYEILREIWKDNYNEDHTTVPWDREKNNPLPPPFDPFKELRE